NPISLEREYRSRIFTLIPQLSSLDADPHNHKKPCRRGSLRDKRDDEDSSGQQGTCLSIPNNNNNDKEDKLIQKLISESTQAEQEQEIAPQNICRDAEDNEGFKDEGTTPRDEISSEELSNEETRLKLLSLRKSMEPTKLRNNNEVNYEMDSSLCSSIASQSTSDSGISETSSGGNVYV
ncbi:Leucinerich repeatcontaining protein 56like, partial [Caligus rogercresseyi]